MGAVCLETLDPLLHQNVSNLRGAYEGRGIDYERISESQRVGIHTQVMKRRKKISMSREVSFWLFFQDKFSDRRAWSKEGVRGRMLRKPWLGDLFEERFDQLR